MPEAASQDFEDPIKDKLVCYQQIPLRWRKLDQPLSEGQWFCQQSDNVKLMEVLVSSDDVGDLESSGDKDSIKEIKRLDAKVNLLMGWIGQFLMPQQALPAAQTVCLSSTGLQFHSDEQQANEVLENDNLCIELFLEPRYPQAFTTAATVVHVTAQPQSLEIVVRFTDINEQNQHWLDKYVFQLHRRQVALSRKYPR